MLTLDSTDYTNIYPAVWSIFIDLFLTLLLIY